MAAGGLRRSSRATTRDAARAAAPIATARRRPRVRARAQPRAPATQTRRARAAHRRPARPGWLYGRPDAGWDRASLERLAQALAASSISPASASSWPSARRRRRRPGVPTSTKTALLHAISHDLRSPLTAITHRRERTAPGRPLGRRPRRAPRGDRGRVRSPRPHGRRPARPVADRGRRGQPAHGLGDLADAVGRAAEQVEQRVRRRIGSSSTSPPTCRWSAPTPPSSSACSRTCSKTP